MIVVYFQDRLRTEGIDLPGNTHDDEDCRSRQECRINKTAAVQMSCETLYISVFMFQICLHLPVSLRSVLSKAKNPNFVLQHQTAGFTPIWFRKRRKFLSKVFCTGLQRILFIIPYPFVNIQICIQGCLMAFVCLADPRPPVLTYGDQPSIDKHLSVSGLFILVAMGEYPQTCMVHTSYSV